MNVIIHKCGVKGSLHDLLKEAEVDFFEENVERVIGIRRPSVVKEFATMVKVENLEELKLLIEKLNTFAWGVEIEVNDLKRNGNKTFNLDLICGYQE